MATSWNELTPYHCQMVNILIHRTLEVNNKYACDKENGTCSKNLEHIKNLLIIDSYCILQNNYPYNLEENIDHFCFWFSQKYTMDEALIIIKNKFNTDNVIIFCNAHSIKSVKEIEHYHIFILRI